MSDESTTRTNDDDDGAAALGLGFLIALACAVAWALGEGAWSRIGVTVGVILIVRGILAKSKSEAQ